MLFLKKVLFGQTRLIPLQKNPVWIEFLVTGEGWAGNLQSLTSACVKFEMLNVTAKTQVRMNALSFLVYRMTYK